LSSIIESSTLNFGHVTCIQEEKAKAKDLHPKLLAGMFFFFALGATGGITALLTSDKPIFERFCSQNTYCSSMYKGRVALQTFGNGFAALMP
jgi:hypothetical protein